MWLIRRKEAERRVLLNLFFSVFLLIPFQGYLLMNIEFVQ